MTQMFGLFVLLLLRFVHSAEARDCSASANANSWVQTYNAAYVRTKADGTVKQAIEAVDPGLLKAVRFLADCPAVPGTFPFAERCKGSRLDQILSSGVVKAAFQDLGPGLATFTKAFKQITDAVVKQIAQHYKVSLKVEYKTYPISDASLKAVVAGKADVTDPFNRQWTLVNASTTGREVQRSTVARPACSLWATALSITWNGTRNKWATEDDLRAAGTRVRIPLYSSVLPFVAEVRNVLPQAVLEARPQQNFETNVTVFNTILTEFARGRTTALLAAPGDLMAVLDRANLDFTFNVSQLKTVVTNVILPVGAFLPLPGALRS